MTQTDTLVAVVDSSKFVAKIAPDCVIAFDGVPMVAHCPDPYSISLTMEQLDGLERETDVGRIRGQLRSILTNILSPEDAARVEEMMSDPGYRTTNPDTVIQMFNWLLTSEEDGAPQWGKAINEYLKKSQAADAPPKPRRVAAKKTAAAPAKKAAAKRAATAAARAKK
jgi:hypothetical protein